MGERLTERCALEVEATAAPAGRRSPRAPAVGTASARPGAVTVLRLGSMRVPGAVLLVAALVRPLLPWPPSIACPLRSLTGIPCPLCGMTTSVTDAVHLRWPEALAANPAGAAGVAAAVVLLVVGRPPSLVVPRWTPTVAVALLWAYQLWRVL